MQGNLRPSAAVIGAGIGGLATATMLARRGWRVDLLERASQPGGRARSRKQDGWVFNQGAHALYRGGAAEEVLAELGVHYTGRPPRTRGYAQWGDTLYRLPSGPATMLTSRFLSPRARLEVLGLLARVRRPAEPSLAAVEAGTWLERKMSQPEARAFALALIRVAAYSSAPDRLSAQVAHDALYRAFTRGVLYLDDGWQSLVDGLAAAARRAGVRVHTGAHVVRLDGHSTARTVVTTDGRRFEAEAVVLAADPETARELLGRPAPGAIRWPQLTPLRISTLDVALRELPRRHDTLVIGVDRPLYLSVHSAVARLAPDGGALIHVMKYHDPHDDGDAEADRAELQRLLSRAQPGWRAALVEARFVPRLTVTHARCDAVSGGYLVRPTAVPGMPDVALVGDWVGSTGLLTDAVLASAREAACRLDAAARTAAPRELVA